jgi:hypothetical protein
MLVVLLTAACTGDAAGEHNPGALFPDRANQYREDQERQVGELAMIGGYSATVTEAGVDEDGRSIRLSVEISNRHDEPQRIDATHWTLVNPRVQTIEVDTATFPASELAGDATVTATVSFAVDPGEVGDYYVQYKPEALDAARGIWRLSVP